MPVIVTAKDRAEARSVALARAAKQGKQGYYAYMRETLGSLDVGDAVTLDSDDLVKNTAREGIETLPTRIASLRDGVTLDEATTKDIGSIRQACERELRKVTNDDKATLVTDFPVTLADDGETIASVSLAFVRTR